MNATKSEEIVSQLVSKLGSPRINLEFIFPDGTRTIMPITGQYDPATKIKITFDQEFQEQEFCNLPKLVALLTNIRVEF